MAVTVYKSTDASAPVLSGSAGALTALLDAVLVGTAGTAYGAKASAGWTKPFSAANKSVYRNNTVGATGFYLDVDDSGPNANLGARSARMRGFETMTAVATGTGPFPTVAQLAAGIQVYKSSTADATAKPWIIVADDKSFWLLTDPGGEISGWSVFHFGDIFSLKTGDLYRAVIIGRTAEGNPGAMLASEERIADLSVVTALAAGHYMPRTWAGAVQSAVNVGKHCGDNAKRALIPYPNPADNSINVSQFWIHEPLTNLGVLRGRLRGAWDFLHDPLAGVNDGDTFAGSGVLAGKSFLICRPVGSSSAPAGSVRILVLETSNTWETST
jgi:hypothetical protein